ncbi:MAG: SIS domain-containing protein, partial [Pseudomonadota bacterium]
MPTWSENIKDTESTLMLLSIRDHAGKEVDPDRGFVRWRDLTLRIRGSRRTVYLVGNGASASMASHISADLAKNANVHTEVFSDLSLITAVANDISYEQVFAEPLRRRMSEGDMLVGISSSGQSPNVLRAAEAAAGLGGIVITLSAMKPENALRSLGVLNFYVPGETYGMAETCHAAILHYWVDQMTATAQQDILEPVGKTYRPI